MKIAIMGTGLVGNLIGSRLIEKGHQVMMSGRAANNESGLTFVKNNPPGTASYGTFNAAPRYADIIFNATNGRFALEALKLADKNAAQKARGTGVAWPRTPREAKSQAELKKLYSSIWWKRSPMARSKVSLAGCAGCYTCV